MSLHIESTEDALAELKKQRVKTLTAAISVSFLGVALMGLLLYLVHIIVAIPEDPPMVAYATQEGDNPDIDTPEVTQTTQRPSSSSTAAQVKVIAAVATADVAVVNPDIEVDVPSEELSMGHRHRRRLRDRHGRRGRRRHSRHSFQALRPERPHEAHRGKRRHPAVRGSRGQVPPLA